MITCEDFCYTGMRVALMSPEDFLSDNDLELYRKGGNSAYIVHWQASYGSAFIGFDLDTSLPDCYVIPLGHIIPYFKTSLQEQLAALKRRRNVIDEEIKALEKLYREKGDLKSSLLDAENPTEYIDAY